VRLPLVKLWDNPQREVEHFQRLCALTVRIFRTSPTRYRTKGTVSFFEREMFHLTHQALEAFVVTDPLLA
jgi:hypothetical protein